MSSVLIDYYKAIEDSSRKMLEAAQAKDWDGVVRYLVLFAPAALLGWIGLATAIARRAST